MSDSYNAPEDRSYNPKNDPDFLREAEEALAAWRAARDARWAESHPARPPEAARNPERGGYLDTGQPEIGPHRATSQGKRGIERLSPSIPAIPPEIPPPIPDPSAPEDEPTNAPDDEAEVSPW